MNCTDSIITNFPTYFIHIVILKYCEVFHAYLNLYVKKLFKLFSQQNNFKNLPPPHI